MADFEDRIHALRSLVNTNEQIAPISLFVASDRLLNGQTPSEVWGFWESSAADHIAREWTLFWLLRHHIVKLTASVSSLGPSRHDVPNVVASASTWRPLSAIASVMREGVRPYVSEPDARWTYEESDVLHLTFSDGSTESIEPPSLDREAATSRVVFIEAVTAAWIDRTTPRGGAQNGAFTE